MSVYVCCEKNSSICTLIRNARLNPEAKNPPKGATREANTAMITACHIIMDVFTSKKDGTSHAYDPNCTNTVC